MSDLLTPDQEKAIYRVCGFHRTLAAEIIAEVNVLASLSAGQTWPSDEALHGLQPDSMLNNAGADTRLMRPEPPGLRDFSQ